MNKVTIFGIVLVVLVFGLVIFTILNDDTQRAIELPVDKESLKINVTRGPEIIILNDDEFDKTWGGLGNRHPSFLGFYVDSHCTEDMIKFMKKHSTMFERGTPLFIEFIGLPEGMNEWEYHSCFEGTKAKRGEDTRANISSDDLPKALKGIYGNCNCQDRVKTNPDGPERCPQPHIVWQNSTHYIDNILCEFIPLDLQRVLDSCNSTGIQPSIGYRYSNDTHTISNNSCEWEIIED